MKAGLEMTVEVHVMGKLKAILKAVLTGDVSDAFWVFFTDALFKYLERRHGKIGVEGRTRKGAVTPIREVGALLHEKRED